MAQGFHVEARVHLWVPQDRFNFRGEYEAASVVLVVKRLNAEPIAGDEKALRARIPDRECKHPPKFLDAALSKILIEVKYYLDVTRSSQDVTLRPKPLLKFAIVVDFPIADYCHCPVFVPDWLLASGEVDDAEPTHANCCVSAQQHAAVVRPAMMQ